MSPHHGQGHLLIDSVAQSPIQTDLEQFQGWVLSGEPVPVAHLHSEEFLLYV